jgi:hypothetical protein
VIVGISNAERDEPVVAGSGTNALPTKTAPGGQHLALAAGAVVVARLQEILVDCRSRAVNRLL